MHGGAWGTRLPAPLLPSRGLCHGDAMNLPLAHVLLEAMEPLEYVLYMMDMIKMITINSLIHNNLLYILFYSVLCVSLYRIHIWYMILCKCCCAFVAMTSV